MKEMIEISNYLLLNYWWAIIPAAAVLGILATYIQYRIENKSDKK
jgi:hypothetical protein